MTVSRRHFLKTTGVLIVSFSAQSLLPAEARAQGPFDTHPSHVDPAQLDSWIAIGSDGAITAFTGKCDLGQGMFTAQTQLVAEELCVPISRVKLLQCDTASCPDEGTTSGSQSTPSNFNQRNLALAAATAREALVNLAAKQWNLSVDQLSVTNGVVADKSGRQLKFEQLIGNRQFHLPLNSAAKRRSPEQWTVLGKPIPSLDHVALMTGQFEFVHNVHLPGMLHGRVVRPPDVGATISAVDESSVRQMPGIVKIVVRKNFVGVIAEKQWQAIQAARQLKVRWNSGTRLTTPDQFYEALRKQPSEDDLLVNSGDVEQQIAQASRRIEATYIYPYQMHASVGSSCAVADVKESRATVWSATQSVYPTRSIVAKLLQFPLENVRVIYVRGSGCYGLNGADTVSFDAALLSQAVGQPVRVQLSRKDEMAWENYGAACVVNQRAALDSTGSILAWSCESWYASRGNRPGYDKPGNVITGTLLGYEPELVEPHAASEPNEQLRNRSNAVPSYFAGCIGEHCGGAGTIRSERVLTHRVASPFYTGPLRSPLRLQNTFAHECFMDEICSQTGVDPVAFRLKYLRDERLIDVVQAAAKRAEWDARPSPKQKMSGNSRNGRGIACTVYEGDNGYAALVAEISVDITTGQVQPRRFVAAIDVGPISNPDGLRNQTEGGILQGMSRALVEQVTWDETRITSTDWRSYKTLFLDFTPPAIDVEVINRFDVPATGAGELGITLVAAAIGNAIFDACNIRLRQVPLTAERIKAALQHASAEETPSGPTFNTHRLSMSSSRRILT